MYMHVSRLNLNIHIIAKKTSRISHWNQKKCIYDRASCKFRNNLVSHAGIMVWIKSFISLDLINSISHSS